MEKRLVFSGCSPQVSLEKMKKAAETTQQKNEFPPLMGGGGEWFKTSANTGIFAPWEKKKKMLQCVAVSSLRRRVSSIPLDIGGLQAEKNVLLNQAANETTWPTSVDHDCTQTQGPTSKLEHGDLALCESWITYISF